MAKRKHTQNIEPQEPQEQQTDQRGKGRPVGSRTVKDVVTAQPESLCKKCGSAKRSRYGNTRVSHYAHTHDGRQCTQVIWRTCKCLDCGQYRNVVFHE